MKQIYVDSLVHDPDALTLLVKKFGVKNVCLGTDYPFPLGEKIPGELINNHKELTQEDKDRLLGLNTFDFLGINPLDYINKK